MYVPGSDISNVTGKATVNKALALIVPVLIVVVYEFVADNGFVISKTTCRLLLEKFTELEP